MRKIDWDKKLSDEDMAFLRQAGIPGMAERVATHQAQFDAEVPEVETPEDTNTRSALDPSARVADPVPGLDQTGAPQLVDPTVSDDAEVPEDEDIEDYDQWSKDDLETEVTARNQMPDTTSVSVTGTGTNGNVLKSDLIKGLRLWDQENPGALSVA